MTRFIDVSTLSQLANRVGVEKFIRGMSESIHSDFLRWHEFEKSARTANHSDIGVIELMPISDNSQFGFKYVNGHPSNTKIGLSTVMAFGALSEVNTGYPLLLSELTLTTAFRTAATSALAAKQLCRPDSRTMAIIGCGAQAEFQVIAFNELLGIKHVNVFDVDPQAMAKLQHNLSMKNITINLKASAREAVAGVDIISTVTADKCWATILEKDMIEPGMHINAIGGDCPGKTELHKDVLLNADIFVEYEPQTRVEGDIQQLPKDHPVTELWEVLAGNKPGRTDADQITVFDSVGFALEDFSALRFIYETSKNIMLGDTIELIPNLDNPKDLYTLTHNENSYTATQKAS